MVCSFFFQAEDGIRDRLVTGVQTCALPIWEFRDKIRIVTMKAYVLIVNETGTEASVISNLKNKIGRASCRERV